MDQGQVLPRSQVRPSACPRGDSLLQSHTVTMHLNACPVVGAVWIPCGACV